MAPRDKITGENYPDFGKKWYKLQLLDTFTEVSDEEYDKTNTKVWGVVTSTQKNTIKNSFNKKTKHTRKEVKQDIINIIKLRDSLNGKKKLYKTRVEELFKKQSRNVSLGFEYFLWDSIERKLLKKNNTEINFEKPGYHIDQEYSTDLTCSYENEEGKNKVIGIDLTFANDEEIVNKKKKKIDLVNKKLKKGLNDYSNIRTPGKTSILILERSSIKLGNNCFIGALNRFYKGDIQKGGPNEYLEKKIKNKLDLFAEIIISIFEKIKNNELDSYKLGENNIEIKKDGNKINFKVYNNNNNSLLFEYILDI